MAIFVYYKCWGNHVSGFPSPPGLPLIGNTLQISSQPQIHLIQWARQFGEVYRLRLGLADWYLLNSPEATKEVLDKQSAVTSSRPPWPVVSQALSAGRRFLLMPYGPEWRRLRFVAHSLLTRRMATTFQLSQELEATQLAYSLLKSTGYSKEFYIHVRRYTVSVLMTSTYGRRILGWVCIELRVFKMQVHCLIGLNKTVMMFVEYIKLQRIFPKYPFPGYSVLQTRSPAWRKFFRFSYIGGGDPFVHCSNGKKISG